jgi:hypothetical protein
MKCGVKPPHSMGFASSKGLRIGWQQGMTTHLLKIDSQPLFCKMFTLSL